MNLRSGASGLLVLVAALLGPAARAQSPGPDEVRVTGCVSKGTEVNCWVLTDERGISYSFTGTPAQANQCVEVTGTRAQGFCMQGTQLALKKLVPSDRDCCKIAPKK
ncbi:MAG TPA: hypothetical protein VMR86_02625 [Myxococcota bacterium]|nr:hypothetical protein [Myxococcota bacterium]